MKNNVKVNIYLMMYSKLSPNIDEASYIIDRDLDIRRQYNAHNIRYKMSLHHFH